MIKKLLFALVAIFSIAYSAQAQTQTYYPGQWQNDANGYRYELDNEGYAKIVDFKYWDATAVTIPAAITVNGKEYKVTKIGDYVFQNRVKVEAITFEGENLEEIGVEAFLNVGCNSQTDGIDIHFPGSLKDIDDRAFKGAKVRRLYFAKTTVAHNDLDIHTDAFYGAKPMDVVELYCSVVGKDSFKECQYLKTLVIGKNVKKICESAFENTMALETIIISCPEPPVCGKDAFKGAGYDHGDTNKSQIEKNGYDENDVYHGTQAAKDRYGNFLHYVNVKLAVSEDDYAAVYAKYKNYAPIAYTAEDGATKYSYQGWQKDRTNQYYIEFEPNEETGKNDGWTIDTNLLKDFGGDPWQRLNANFYYSRMTEEEVDKAIEDGTISDPIEFIDFKLTLDAIGKSEYTPGRIDSEKGYIDGTNSYSADLTPANTDGHGKISLPVGTKLSIYSYDENGDSTLVGSVTVEGNPMTLAELETKLGTQTQSGVASGATYKMVLDVAGGDTYVSEPAAVEFSQPEKTVAVAINRSGTPDEATCAEKEMFTNQITFATDESVDGYYIYRNGEIVATLTRNADGIYKDENGNEYVADGGELVYVDNAEADPIKVGENKSSGDALAADWYYEVVSFGDNGTCGGGTQSTTFEGSVDELAVSTNVKAVSHGYSCAEIVTTTTLEWSLNEGANAEAISGYEIWRKVGEGENATYEKVGEVGSDVTTFTDSYKYGRENQSWSKPDNSEFAEISYYVKAITNTTSDAQNMKEKNSNVVDAKAQQGSIHTGVEGVDAQSATIAVANGIITVTGAEGAVEVYNMNGTIVAKVVANGEATAIDATRFATGAYIVKAANETKKILIK